MSTRLSANCLESYNTTWPRDGSFFLYLKNIFVGIIRLEIVDNLDVLRFKEEWIRWYSELIYCAFLYLHAVAKFLSLHLLSN